VAKTRAMDTGRRWLAVGHSAASDSRQAGRDAVRGALDGGDPKLLVVFSSGPDPEQLLAGIDEVCPGVPLIGCASQALISSTAASGPVGGVVVTALGGPGFTVTTGAASAAADQRRAAGAQVASCAAALPEDCGPNQILLLLTEGVLDHQEDILAGAYSVVGASAPLIGGTSGPDPGLGWSYQLHGREVLRNAAVGAMVASDGPFGIAMRHGGRKVGEPMIVTHAVRGDLYTLDDKPALTAYLDRLNAPPEAYADPAVFDMFNRSRPIGIRRRGGEEVRHVNSVSRLKETWLRSSGEVPEGGLIWVMQGDRESTLDAANEACKAAIDALDGAPPLGLLAFDCISRSRVLGGEGTVEEVERMVKVAAGAPLAGFYTWGEIARTRGITGYHNQTLAVLAVG
jgi:hypothetical protein